MPPPAATYFAALQRDARTRRWLVVAVVGANAWLLTNLVLHWHHAVLAATAAVAALLWWDHSHGSLTDWWSGNQTLHRLAAAAARLERHGWVTVPSPAVPGQTTAHVYLLIGPAGVFVVQARFWPATGTIPHLRAVAAAAQHQLADHLPAGVPIQPVLAVIEGPAPDQPRTVDDVTILPATSLVPHLRGAEPVIPPAMMADLRAVARRMFTSG
jgi:hypothetical protein